MNNLNTIIRYTHSIPPFVAHKENGAWTKETEGFHTEKFVHWMNENIKLFNRLIDDAVLMASAANEFIINTFSYRELWPTAYSQCFDGAAGASIRASTANPKIRRKIFWIQFVWIFFSSQLIRVNVQCVMVFRKYSDVVLLKLNRWMMLTLNFETRFNRTKTSNSLPFIYKLIN